MNSYPLLESISTREASDRVFRTRRARGGFVLLRTLDARGNANTTPPANGGGVVPFLHLKFK